MVVKFLTAFLSAAGLRVANEKLTLEISLGNAHQQLLLALRTVQVFTVHDSPKTHGVSHAIEKPFRHFKMFKCPKHASGKRNVVLVTRSMASTVSPPVLTLCEATEGANDCKTDTSMARDRLPCQKGSKISAGQARPKTVIKPAAGHKAKGVAQELEGVCEIAHQVEQPVVLLMYKLLCFA